MNVVIKEHQSPTGQALQLVQGDITLESVEAIVNAANEDLAHGGGVAWAIVRRGGDIIQSESNEWIRNHGRVSHSHPAWTSGGALPSKYVIHAVGPVWGSGDEDNKLASAITGALHTANELKCASISIPAISTGIFGFPKERAAKIIVSCIEKYFSAFPHSKLRQIRITIIDAPTIQAFLTVFPEE